jgi:hypothetical protein
VTTNAVTTWTTEFLGLAGRRPPARSGPTESIRSCSPTSPWPQSDNIGLFGTITVDIDAELARLDPAGHRPLRNPSTVVSTTSA